MPNSSSNAELHERAIEASIAAYEKSTGAEPHQTRGWIEGAIKDAILAYLAIAPQAEATSTPVGFEAAWAAFQNCPIDGTLDDEDNMRAALRAALAINTQEPVSLTDVKRDRDSYYRAATEWALAAHRKDELIRELVTMIGQALADTERSPLEIGFNHSSETARELAQRLILVRNGLFDALAKAKAAGYEL